jgi:hypothetical protein
VSGRAIGWRSVDCSDCIDGSASEAAKRKMRKRKVVCAYAEHGKCWTGKGEMKEGSCRGKGWWKKLVDLVEGQSWRVS